MGNTPHGASSRTWHRSLLAIGFLAVAAFYAWTNDPTGASWRIGAEQTDYYNLLIDGFQKGHLYMDVAVSEELKASPDPWNPEVRGPTTPILQDATYYDGHFYLYYGVAPVATLMLPFRLITGADMPLPLATLCFAWAGLLTAIVLWSAIRERYFPEVRPWVGLAAVLIVGVASPLPAILRRTLVYELPVTSGFCFGMVALLALYRCLHSERFRLSWLALASVAVGLAVASRLTFLFVMPILLVPVWLAWRDRDRGNLALPLRVFAAAVVPIGAIGALMALYNYQRFGEFTEFGTRYQVAEMFHLAKMVKFSAAHILFNLANYFAAPPDLSRYFPYFIIPGAWPWSVRPAADYWGSELVPGMLVCFPISWLALLSLFSGAPLADPQRGRLRGWLFCAWGLFLGNATCLAFFHAGIIRYMVDFTPTLMLCAAVGLLVLERGLRRRGIVVKVAGRVAWLGLLAASVAVAVMLSLQLHGTFRAAHPVRHAEAAKFLENVAFWNPRLERNTAGPVEITLRIDDAFAVGRSEPLLTRGAGAAAEHVFLRRSDAEHLVVGYRRGPNSEPQLSQPVPVKAGGVHLIQVDLGSLYPRASPAVTSTGVAAPLLERLQQRWMILVDDHLVLQGRYERETTAPDADLVFVGYNPTTDEFGKVRLNRILSARRLSLAEVAGRAAHHSTLGLEFKAPRDGAQGAQALLAIEGPGAEFRAEIEYLPAGQAAVTFWSNGHIAARGQPFPIDGQWHRLDIEQVPVGREKALQVRMDGKPVAELPAGAVDLRRDVFKAGWAAAGTPRFTGFIRNAGSDGDQSVSLAPRGDRIALAVIFPRQRSGVSEPLLVTGRNGAGDLYEVVYLGEDRVCFKHDHWGDGFVRTSPAFSVKPDVPHRLVFEFTPNQGGAASDAARVGVMHLEVDGLRVWETDAPGHAFKATEVYVGFNEIGGTTCDRQFSGEILSYEANAAPEPRVGK